MNFDNAIWDDGEWVSWDEINQQIQYKEWRAKYPKGDVSLIPIFEQMIITAQEYFQSTGNHLQVYGVIGELFAAITHGIKLHKVSAQGSDGRMKDDFIEVKTLAPFSTTNTTSVKMTGNFNKLLIVNINNDFEISEKLIDRAKLPNKQTGILKVKWSDY